MMRLAEQVIDCCRDLARFTEAPGQTTRTFLSPPMRDVHRVLGAWMERIGMHVRVDAAGNLRGLSGETKAPRLLIGSHLDTVPDAGAFDGILGVVMGIAIAELTPGTPLEVVGFSEEEGVRFGTPFIGSRALIGDCGEAMLALTDVAGISVRQAIEGFGLDPADLPVARIAPEVIAYLEFHIEQGPVLESLGLQLGVVDTIAGQSRWAVTFEGRANHAGTTPMSLRRDALVAASRWVVSVAEYAMARPGLVATVGWMEVSPNAGNVVPGRVRASLDVRHAEDTVRLEAVRDLLRLAGAQADERLNQPSVAMDAALCDRLAEAVGGATHRMTSGAGHDAMILARRIPSTMLFLRSPGGMSHHPDEAVLPEDVAAALEAGMRFVKGFHV